VTLPNRKHEREIGEAGDEVDNTQAGDGTANEVVHEDRAQFRPRRDEVVAIPEARPGEHEEQQPDFQEERDGYEPPDQNITLASAPWSAV